MSRSRVVRAALPADLDAIYRLLADAGARLAEDGFFNWTPPYPRERIATDIAAGVIRLVLEDSAGKPPDAGDPGTVVATFALRDEPVHRYLPPPWPKAGLRAWYLNRMAVAPGAQGRGIGSWCLGQLREYALEAAIQAIRCDVLAANATVCAFYERAGYRACGRRSHSGWEFSCYELRVAGTVPQR